MARSLQSVSSPSTHRSPLAPGPAFPAVPVIRYQVPRRLSCQSTFRSVTGAAGAHRTTCDDRRATAGAGGMQTPTSLSEGTEVNASWRTDPTRIRFRGSRNPGATSGTDDRTTPGTPIGTSARTGEGRRRRAGVKANYRTTRKRGSRRPRPIDGIGTGRAVQVGENVSRPGPNRGLSTVSRRTTPTSRRHPGPPVDLGRYSHLGSDIAALRRSRTSTVLFVPRRRVDQHRTTSTRTTSTSTAVAGS